MIDEITPLDALRDALHGVGVTPVTPFADDLSLDLGGLRRNIEFLMDEGVRLLYPAGNTGEVASLSAGEWTDVVETVLDTAAGKAMVVPGITHELPVALELAGRARDLGAGGLLLMPRQQPYADSSGMVEYWRMIAEAGRLPVVLYRRGLPDDQALLEAVTDDLVAGCKYAGRDVASFSHTAGRFGTVWTCGLAERYAPFFHAAGAVGFTSGLANFAPHLSLALQAALCDDDLVTAIEIGRRCGSFEEVRARDGDALNVAAVKAAMEEVGLAGGPVRPPLRDVDPATRAEVRRMAEAMKREGR